MCASRAGPSPLWPRIDCPRYTFTFADHFTEPLCALARSVEAAGGLLHVLGLQDGRTAQLPFAVNGRRARAPG